MVDARAVGRTPTPVYTGTCCARALSIDSGVCALDANPLPISVSGLSGR
jgi:hypothetical protein